MDDESLEPRFNLLLEQPCFYPEAILDLASALGPFRLCTPWKRAVPQSGRRLHSSWARKAERTGPVSSDSSAFRSPISRPLLHHRRHRPEQRPGRDEWAAQHHRLQNLRSVQHSQHRGHAACDAADEQISRRGTRCEGDAPSRVGHGARTGGNEASLPSPCEERKGRESGRWG